MRCPCTRSAAVLLAVVLCTCTDSPTGPRHIAGRISLAPVYSRQAHEIAQNLAAANLPIDKVFVEVRGSAGDVRASELVDFPANQQQTTVSLEVSLNAPQEQLTANLELRSGTTPIFSSTTPVVVKAAETTAAQSDTLVYVGPGKEATVLNVQPGQATIAQTGSQQFSAAAFAADESPVNDLPITGWTSSDSTIATVTDAGLAQAVKSGTVTITAHALSLLTATASLHVVGLPTRVTVLSGGGQTGVVGTTLAQPFKVQLLSEAGEPVPGVTVNFQAVTPGGRVATAAAMTDAQGSASTMVTVGTTAGPYVFRAVLPGGPLDATITAAAQASAASAIAKVSGDAQSGAAGQLLPAPLVVRVSDAFGNPVGGVSVTFTRLTGSGSIGTTTAMTGADGTASTAYTLGTSVGTETVRSQVAGLTGITVTFTITSTAGSASAVALVSGDGQHALAGSALANPLVVIVTDSYGNPIGGISVAWAVASGGGTLSADHTTTNAAGQTSVTFTTNTHAGSATISASVAGATKQFTVFGDVGGPARMSVALGDQQSAVVGTTLKDPPTVIVVDANGNPVTGVAVTFTVGANSGAVGTGQGFTASVTVNTDASGNARVNWQLGSTAGQESLSATSGQLTPLSFTATATAAAAAQLGVITSPNSPVASGAIFANQPVIEQRDQFGNPIQSAGVTITASVPTPYALIGSSTAVTAANGRATFTTLGVSGPPGPVITTFSATGLAPATATVTVVVPTVSWVTTAQSAPEGKTATITAQLSSVPAQAVSIPYVLSGSATLGSDYSITASPLVIPAGSTQASVTVTVLDDGIAEPDETIVVTMGIPTNATLGSPAQHTITIPEQLPTVSFTTNAQSVSEAAGTAVIAAVLSSASTRDVTVPFQVSGTATSPSDYTIASSPLVIPAGKTSATIPLTIVNDAVSEPNETVIVTLGAPTNATLGSTASQTVTILDDDEALAISFAGRGFGSVVSQGVTPAINCSSSTPTGTCSGTYTLGTQVTLTATPLPTSEGIYHFEGWTGSGTGFTCTTNPTCVVPMSQSQQVTARFSVPGAITYSPSSATFSMVRGSPVPPPTTIKASDTGERSLQLHSLIGVTYAPNVLPWLNVTIDKLTIDTLSPATLTLQVAPDTLSAGTYQASVTLLDSGEQRSWSFVVTLVIAPGPTPPVLSNATYTLIKVNDSNLCTLPGTPTGSSFQVDFDYSDVNGDGPTSLAQAHLNLNWLFTPLGNPGGFSDYVYRSSLTGDGRTGHATTIQCYYFGSNTAVTVTMTILDVGGLRSSSSDPNAKVTIPRPAGSN